MRARAGVAVLALALSVIGAPGCGRSGEGAEGGDEGTTGYARLRFSGAVTGTFEGEVEVACFEPDEEGEGFAVSVDSETGAPVGAHHLVALDFATPGYRGATTYDLGDALRADQGFDPGDFILIFEEMEDRPFTWGGEAASGTVTIDDGESSGRVALQGWENASGAVDVEGTFRCGRKPGR